MTHTYWPGDCIPGDDGNCRHCTRPMLPGLHRNCPRRVPPASHSSLVAESLASIGEAGGLGDMTAAALNAIGITKERVNAWQGEIGPCQSCVARQEWLNKLGHKIAGFLHSAKKS